MTGQADGEDAAAALIGRLQLQLGGFLRRLAGIDEARWRWRPSPATWSAIENVAHVARHLDVFLQRIDRLVAERAISVVPYDAALDPDWEAWRGLSVPATLDRLRSLHERLEARVRTLTPDDWTTCGTHARMGRLTLDEWVEFVLLHEAHHFYVAFSRAHAATPHVEPRPPRPARTIADDPAGAPLRTDVFFYGLFMDEQLLRAKGLAPLEPEPASVDGFAIRIGQRAALVPAPGSRVHGIVVSLTLPDVHALYSEPGVQEYRPHAVLARLAQGETVPAVCYNLSVPPVADTRDTAYAAALRDVGRKVGLPAAYVDSLA